MTAEKGDKELDEEKKNKGGFFGKLKMGFRNRRGKSLRGVNDMNRLEEGERWIRVGGPEPRGGAVTSVSNGVYGFVIINT